MMLFDNEPTIILLDYPAVANAYRIQFDAMWAQSIVPESVSGKMKNRRLHKRTK